MNNLLSLVEDNQADTIPASEEQIEHAELELGLKFSQEYRRYLRQFGVISFGPNETYGLGVKDTSFLNIVTALTDFRAIEGFPKSLIPISDIGDGHYYMYDNSNLNIVTVSLPGIGIKQVGSNLESFLAKLIFQ